MKLVEQIYNNEEINYIYDNCKWTPVLQQWKDIKEESVKKYGLNTIVFFQLGTFFECYFHDAYISSKLISQTLTSKNKNDPLAAPMAGSPVSVGYKKAKDLVDKGLNVIIVEEKGVAGTKQFQRVISKVLTPGTSLDNIWSLHNNYVYSITGDQEKLWITILDVSSNILQWLELEIENIKQLEKYFHIYPPKEILYEDHITLEFQCICNYISSRDIDCQNKDINANIAQKIANKPHLKESLDLLLSYVEDIHKKPISYLNHIEIINPKDFFYLEKNTVKHLEILTNSEGYVENSLLDTIRCTQTSFWGRFLKRLLLQPTINKKKLENRYDVIDYLKKGLAKKIGPKLFSVNDIERLSSKLISGSINPNDILSLARSLKILETIKEEIYSEEPIKSLSTLLDSIPSVDAFLEKVSNTLKEEGGVTSREGNIIKSGVNSELDSLIIKTEKSKQWYKYYEEKLSQQTGRQIKVSENNLGPYIEVSKNEDLQNIEGLKKIKMLKDYDRYQSKELLDYHRELFDARLRRNELEYQLFESLRLELSKSIPAIHKYSNVFAYIDVLISFTINAINNNYTRPLLSKEPILNIKNGRHPIVESKINFIWNDTLMEEKKIFCITGPNMWGKSTYLRQNALIILLAQIGSFIPADEGSKIGLVDNIFTRIGSGDDLVKGESTFFTEMKETSHILHNATKNSIIILDELGRGTCTQDGQAITQSVLEYCVSLNVRTFLATHYHSLSDYTSKNSNSENYSVWATLWENNKISFSHKIKKGNSNKSYGIEIAALADMPENIINRAISIKNEK